MSWFLFLQNKMRDWIMGLNGISNLTAALYLTWTPSSFETRLTPKHLKAGKTSSLTSSMWRWSPGDRYLVEQVNFRKKLSYKNSVRQEAVASKRIKQLLLKFTNRMLRCNINDINRNPEFYCPNSSFGNARFTALNILKTSTKILEITTGYKNMQFYLKTELTCCFLNYLYTNSLMKFCNKNNQNLSATETYKKIKVSDRVLSKKHCVAIILSSYSA